MFVYKLTIRKYSSSRWSYTVNNPQGGSFSTTSFKSQKVAIARGLLGLPAGSEVEVTCMAWDPTVKDYVVTKRYNTMILPRHEAQA